MTREQLLPAHILEQLPKLNETGVQDDHVAIVKFFYPDFDWTWYAIEFDGDDLFYGYVIGDIPEYGSFRLSELMENRGKMGLEIERDLYFEPTPVSEILAKSPPRRLRPVAEI